MKKAIGGFDISQVPSRIPDSSRLFMEAECNWAEKDEEVMQ